MKLLLHICCGPCSLYVIDKLKELLNNNGDSITGIFANPNIHPYDEFLRRQESTKIACVTKNIPVIILDDFDKEKWENYSGIKQNRCSMCYNTRLDMVSKYAKENSFTHFTTTLLVSPYQNKDLIKSEGERLAEIYGINFLYSDFSEGFREGQKQAKELGLYRQKYCGCIKSLSER